MSVPQSTKIIPLQFFGLQSLSIYCDAPSEFIVVMVNGGAQTRCGSHRMQQQLALAWQQAGLASVRFDFPGYGDADGPPGNFIDHAQSLEQIPDQLCSYFGKPRPLVFFGLCDGATAALLASTKINPMALMLLNPWLRIEQNHSAVMLKFYYLNRLMTPAFWQKVVRGEWKVKQSLSSLIRFLKPAPITTAKTDSDSQQQNGERPSFTQASESTDQTVLRALQYWLQYKGPVQLVLSSADLTASECHQLLQQKKYRKLSQQAAITEISNANHTVTDPAHFDLLAEVTTRWLTQLVQRSHQGTDSTQKLPEKAPR